MRKLETSEVKQTIFDILCAFADYCDKYQLRYYLSGGTLLGAIRHKDFIPWDDDIDLLMPRPDYGKLHELLKNESIRPYYKLISLEAGNSFWPFAKLIDTRTHTENTYATTDRWLWIDIFPMDGLPNDEEESNKILSQAPPMKIWFNRCNAKIGEGKGTIRSIMKIPMILALRLYTPERLGRKLDTLAKQYSFEDSDYVGGIAWSLGPKERMYKTDYLVTEDVEFHGRKFHAPACWDYYLSRIYGDYMQLPPENQRVNHDFTAYIED